MTPPPNFDRLAPAYHLLEFLTFGSLLWRCRVAHPDRLSGCRSALILGDGDGRFLAALLQTNPAIRVDSIDISPAMIAQARRRVQCIPGAAERVRFVTADARTTSPPGSGYDLVVTNFFLDCFPPAELKNVMDRIAAACDSAAVWVDGDFRLPARGGYRIAARVLLTVMYAFFRLVTRLPAGRLTDPTPHFQAHDFSRMSERSWLGGFLSSRVWSRARLSAPDCYDGRGETRL